MSLTLSGVWPLSLHLDLFNSVGRYSLTSRCKKWLTICCTFFQDLKLAGSWLSNFPGGRELNGLLIRKWFGVRGISFSGRSATIVSGLEFNIASARPKLSWKHQATIFWSLEWSIEHVVQQSSQKWNLKTHWLLSLLQPKRVGCSRNLKLIQKT